MPHVEDEEKERFTIYAHKRTCKRSVKCTWKATRDMFTGKRFIYRFDGGRKNLFHRSMHLTQATTHPATHSASQSLIALSIATTSLTPSLFACKYLALLLFMSSFFFCLPRLFYRLHENRWRLKWWQIKSAFSSKLRFFLLAMKNERNSQKWWAAAQLNAVEMYNFANRKLSKIESKKRDTQNWFKRVNLIWGNAGTLSVTFNLLTN